MARHRIATALLVLLALEASAADPLDLARLKPFAAFRASSSNPDPASNDDSLRPIPGETVVLADLEGPGAVRHVWLTVASGEYGWPRLLRLRVYYDGSPVPSVDVPVGDFFGSGHGREVQVESFPVRASSEGRSRNCYWPMPFARSCRITVTNEGRRRVSNLYYHVDWQRLDRLDDDVAYFHARYHQELPAEPGRPYTVLAIKGEGHYVGTVLSVIQAEVGWFGEGDERIFVDGAAEPAMVGTGTEDYFNDAWSLRVGHGPYAGVSVAEGTGLGARLTGYRWHLEDPIPFRRSLRFDLEHNGWTYNADGSVRSASEERADLFSSVAFWYQRGVARGLAPPPFGPARLPHGNALQVEVEGNLSEIQAEGGSASVLTELFWGKDVLWLEAFGSGARFELPFEVPVDGRWELLLEAAHTPDSGTYSVLLDGRSTDPPALENEPGATVLGNRVNAYGPEVFVGASHLVGWFDLAAGRHTLTLVSADRDPRSSGDNLGLDALILARTGRDAWPGDGGWSRAADALRALAELGPAERVARLDELRAGLTAGDPAVRRAAAEVLAGLGPASAPALPGLTRALVDPDPVVRGLAAVALRDLGPAATDALAALVAALSDRDENVRLMVADALAAQGEGAAPAVPALIRLCRSPDQHVHVLRSAATALGAVGPAAAGALPVLRELEKIPRVSWPAAAAIRRIRATPSPPDP